MNLNLNDKKVQDIVTFTLLSVNQQGKSEKSHMLSKIINVSKQVRREISCILYFVHVSKFNHVAVLIIIDCVWNHLQC